MTDRDLDGAASTGVGIPLTVRPLDHTSIRWTLDDASPWTSSRPVLTVALDALPLIEDDVAGDIILQMATTIADLQMELSAIREVLSESMTFAAAQHGQARNARQRLADRLHVERRIP